VTDENPTARGGPPPAPSATGEALYQERILEYFRHPRGKGSLPVRPDAVATAHNRLCGEEVTVTITLDGPPGGQRVRDVRFLSDGCSITQASASMMTELAAGRTAEEIAALAADLRRIVHGEPVAAPDDALGPLVNLRAIARVPARIPCALLAWEALASALGASR